jgi:hypothetical protein
MPIGKTKSGHTKKRNIVKLDLSGLEKFGHSFGPNGQTFNLGIFDPKNAAKGAALEYGDDSINKKGEITQVPRPWLSAIKFKGSPVQRKLVRELGNYAKASFKGLDDKRDTASKIETIIKDFVADQEFATGVPKLKDVTVASKKRKKKQGKSSGIYSADTIGVDTGEMIRNIKVRTKGGRRKTKK